MSRPKNRSGPENPDEKARSPDSGKPGEPENEETEGPGKPQNGPYPPDLDHYLVDEDAKRRFITYAEGARMFCVPYGTFVRMAKMADANYPIRKSAIVDLRHLEAYMEKFHEQYERIWGEVPKRRDRNDTGKNTSHGR